MYTFLDGAWHQVDDDEHTACGLVIPPLNGWVREVPETVHCGPNATEQPKAKAKKG